MSTGLAIMWGSFKVILRFSYWVLWALTRLDRILVRFPLPYWREGVRPL